MLILSTTDKTNTGSSRTDSSVIIAYTSVKMQSLRTYIFRKMHIRCYTLLLIPLPPYMCDIYKQIAIR